MIVLSITINGYEHRSHSLLSCQWPDTLPLYADGVQPSIPTAPERNIVNLMTIKKLHACRLCMLDCWFVHCCSEKFALGLCNRYKTTQGEHLHPIRGHHRTMHHHHMMLVLWIIGYMRGLQLPYHRQHLRSATISEGTVCLKIA